MVSSSKNECMMKFGIALKFDSSSEKNLTAGIKKQTIGSVEFDGNQQSKYVARRNHP